MARWLYAAPSVEDIWEDVHYLTYRAPWVGSYGYGLADVLAMDVDWFRWAVKRQERARQSEAAANKPKKR
jgi:hypothetical protein